MTRRKKVFLTLAIIFLIVFGSFFFFLYYGLSSTRNLTINDVNLANISDGNYSGNYRKGRFAYSVQVRVKNGKIEEISILDVSKISLPEIAEKLTQEIIQKQTLKVDTITGATASSKAFLKAVENALKK